MEVFNDIDDGITHFYRVLRDPSMAEELIRRLELTPYSRREYYECLHTWQSCTDPVERARRWFLVQATSFNGRFGAGLRISKRSAKGFSAEVSAYITRVARLQEVADRFRRVIVENLDFREVVKRYDSPDTAFYADPPYVRETRDKTSTYVHELTVEDHKDLVNLALATKGSWVISGYEHPVYAPLESAGWKKVTWSVRCLSASYNACRETMRTEVLWVSPPEPRGHVVGTLGAKS